MARLEAIFEREQRILLLTFDECEKLEEAEQDHSLPLRPLLDWLRDIIQFHLRIALLFSGVKTFDEMGQASGLDWNGYCINVQMFHLSFLKPNEAQHLILQPTPTYPGVEIFPPAVVESIIATTACHPFLLQSICSALITLFAHLWTNPSAASWKGFSMSPRPMSQGWPSIPIYPNKLYARPRKNCCNAILSRVHQMVCIAWGCHCSDAG